MHGDAFLALVALGPDRPGIVADLTAYVTEAGGNVEDSRMAILGGEFGVLLLVSGAPERVEAIERDLDALGKKTDLRILSHRTKSPEDHRREAGIPCVVTVEALDHEGIVRAVALGLRNAGVNVVSLATEAYQAPVTGSQLFRLEARIDVPPGVSVGDVRKAMDSVAEAENLDIDVRSLIGRSG